MDDSVVRYMDVQLPLASIHKGLNDTKSMIGEFEKSCIQREINQQDVVIEQSTIMEGFRYRVDDTNYPVFQGNKKLEDFPIIPIGMLDIWRAQDEGFDYL